MGEGKLLVVVIRTPKSDRYLPIETLFKDEITPFSDHMEAHRRIDELAQQTKEKINETWKQVELIAVNYGGTLPQKK